MAAIANITVKAANGTTDVVYTGVSGGDAAGTPAVWRNEDSTLAIGQRKNAIMLSKLNQKKNARLVTLRFRFPVIRMVNSVPTYVGTIPMEITSVVGDQYLQSEIDEAMSQGLNLAGATLLRDSFKSGYVPV